MARFGLAVSSVIFVAAASAQAQSTTSSERLVQAFQHYCIDTDPERARAELTANLGRPGPPGMDFFKSGDVVHRIVYETWTEQGDPHIRLLIDIIETDGVPHGCRVLATWGEKSDIIKKLSASVVLAEATTRLEHGAELIRWMARARGVPAEIELRVPTYVNEPGRFLTLLDKEALRIRKELQNLEDLEKHQRTDGR